MKTTVVGKLKQVVEVDTIPDGIYTGRWGGYSLNFYVGGTYYEAKTSNGVRGLNCPCNVISKDGEISVESV